MLKHFMRKKSIVTSNDLYNDLLIRSNDHDMKHRLVAYQIVRNSPHSKVIELKTMTNVAIQRMTPIKALCEG